MLILYFVPYPLFVGMAVLFVLLYLLHRSQYRLPYLLAFALFWFYLLLLIALTSFPIPIDLNANDMDTQERLLFVLSHVNLIPFYYAGYVNVHVIVREIVGNILLTMPFGFGINFLTSIHPKKMFRVAILVGFSIEFVQLMLTLLFGGYRTVDITDVILNAAGVFIGYGFFLLANLFVQRIHPLLSK